MAGKLSGDEIAKLVRILGMLGSSCDGERAAAGLLASQMLRAKGLQWADVVSGGVVRSARQPVAQRQPPTFTSPPSRFAVQQMLRYRDALTDWEADFLSGLCQFKKLSAKQETIYQRIAEKVWAAMSKQA